MCPYIYVNDEIKSQYRVSSTFEKLLYYKMYQVNESKSWTFFWEIIILYGGKLLA